MGRDEEGGNRTEKSVGGIHSWNGNTLGIGSGFWPLSKAVPIKGTLRISFFSRRHLRNFYGNGKTSFYFIFRYISRVRGDTFIEDIQDFDFPYAARSARCCFLSSILYQGCHCHKLYHQSVFQATDE